MARQKRNPERRSTEWFRARIERRAPKPSAEKRRQVLDSLRELPPPRDTQLFGNSAEFFVLALVDLAQQAETAYQRPEGTRFRRGRPEEHGPGLLKQQVHACLRSCGLSKAKSVSLVHSLLRYCLGTRVTFEALRVELRRTRRKAKRKKETEATAAINPRALRWAAAVREDWVRTDWEDRKRRRGNLSRKAISRKNRALIKLSPEQPVGSLCSPQHNLKGADKCALENSRSCSTSAAIPFAG